MSKYIFLNKKWKRREIILFLEQLALYVSSGLPINRALTVVGETLPKRRAPVVRRLLDAVEAGQSFADSFSVHISSDITVVGILRQGESMGELAGALQSAQVLLERGDELRKKCLSALAYPMVIGIFSALLTIGLVRGIMPQIIPLLTSLNVELPLLTRVVIAVSQGLISYGVYVFGLSIIAIIILRMLYRRRTVFRVFAQRCVLRTPILGRLIFHYNLSVFLRSCGSLVRSGAPLSDAYSSSAGGVSMLPVSRRLKRHASLLMKGTKVASVLAEKSLGAPAYVPALAAAGEASGTLGDSLIRAADVMDRDLGHSLKKLTSLVEPLLMAGMGCAIGAIALSIMLPIYDISKVLQR